MKLTAWLLAGVVAIGVAAFLVDRQFSKAVFTAGNSDDRSVLIASEGILPWRRAVHLTCSPGGQVRVVTKVRFEFRDPLRPGARSNGSSFHLSAFERRLNADIQVSVPMTITATDWVDTLESDPLDQDTVERVAEGLRDPALDFVAVHGFEHGFYFERSGSLDLQPIERCLPKIRNASARQVG